MFGKETFLLLFLSISNWTFSSVTLTDTLFISSCFSFTLNVKKKKKRNQCYIEFGGILPDFESTAIPIYRNLWTLVAHARFPVYIWNREVALKHHKCFVKMYKWHVLWCLQIQGARFCVWIWWRPTCYCVSSSFQVSCFHHLQSRNRNEFNSIIVTVTYCCFLYHDSYLWGYFLCTFWNVTYSLNSIFVIFLKFM